MRHLVSSALCALLSVACLAQTVPLRWAAELGDVRPARFTLVRGDTVELAADLFAEGRPYLPATADAALLWQTNGMGALWWEIPAAVASNRVSATWTPAMDCGAASYLAHFRVGSSTGSVFRAYARLAMQHGPGDPVNALPLPVPFIDFDKVVVTNAPWGAGGTDGQAVTNIVNGILADATNGVVKVENGQLNLNAADISAGSATLGILAVGDLRAGGAAAYYGGDGDEYELAVKGDIPDLNNYTGNIHTGGSIDAGEISVQGASVATMEDISGFAVRTNLPPLSASATVGDLVDAINAISTALRPEEP